MGKENIPEGFKNLLLAKARLLSEDMKDLSKARMEVCEECPLKSRNNVCTACGCYLPAKTKVKEELCPKNKW